MQAARDQIQASIAKLEKWVVTHDYRAYDTFDGLASPFADLFTLRHPFLRRVWQQGVRRFPMNLRPLLGIQPSQGSKAMGFFAQGYLRLYQASGQESYRGRMRFCLDWLKQHRCPEFKGNAWGNHFDYESRGGRIPCGTPTVVWTSLIGHAFLDAYDEFSSEEDLAVAVGVAEFIAKELGWLETGKDICLNYIPANGGRPAKGEHGIHNSNVLGAGLLARVHALSPNPLYAQIAKQAVQFTVRDQMAHGAWNYGSHPRWHWVDSFHTGYNLEAIDHYVRGTGDKDFQASLAKGYQYFVDTFFGADGTPRYYNYKTAPLDIQCASQGIQTLVNLRNLDDRSVPLAEKVACWTIANMQDADGHFYYRKYPLMTNKTPTLHWGQATMFAALATFLAETGTTSKMAASQPASAVQPAQVSSPSLSLRCALVTPARNEEKFIEGTIKSVAAQTVRPVKWIIVSDGSTDRTDEIVKQYAQQHSWIELLRMPERRDRQFAAKARAFNAGCDLLKEVECDVIGNLDADITFEPDYLEFLLGKFAADPRLGVAGTPFSEDFNNPHHHTYAHKFANTNHVSGACQLFRRECFREIGGYVPIKGGAIDWIAVTTARMKGWKTRTFLEKTCFHHRELGTGNHSFLGARFKYGQKAYYMGGHPLWETMRGFFQMRQKPFVIGGALFLCGYLSALVKGVERPISPELIQFYRSEQMGRLARIFRVNKPKPISRTPNPGHCA